MVIDGEYIWKYTHQAYDFSVLGNTPITFPDRVGQFQDSRIRGSRQHAELPRLDGVCGDVQRGGALLRAAGQRHRRDARRSEATEFSASITTKFSIQRLTCSTRPWKHGPWLGFNWRYDSGLVAGPVPCAGGNCANGPNGTDSIVDVSGLTPDQQFQAGLFCGSVHATPTTSNQPHRPLPRVAVRLHAGQDSGGRHRGRRSQSAPHRVRAISSTSPWATTIIFHGDKYKWSARVTVVNLTNKEALYNFLSTFSGTHYVTPRAVTATIGFHF